MRINRLTLRAAAATAALLLAASCAQEELDNYVPEKTGRTVTYTATIGSDDADTKAALGTNENGKPQTVWSAGDKITVHNGDKGYVFATDDAGKSAEFTYDGNDFTADKGVVAVYPAGDYDAEIKEKDGKTTITVSTSVPSVQTATAGSYDPAAAVSVAYSTDDHLRFKNATAMLKFTVGTENIKSVVFEGLDGEAVSGDMEVEMKADGSLKEVAATPHSQSSFAVELVAPEGEMLQKGVTYYVAITPQTFEKGFNVSFRFVTDGIKYPAFEYAVERTIDRNVILNLGELKFDLTELQLQNVTPELGSFKFEVSLNPGKILPKKLGYKAGSNGFMGLGATASVPTLKETVTEEKCTVDPADKKITLYLPYLNDRRLVPTFEIPNGTVLLCNGRVVESGVTEVDFTGNPQVVVRNGAGTELVFDVEFTNTGLPVVVVNQKTGLVTSASGDTQKGSKIWYDATGAGWQPKESDWAMTEGDDNFMIYNADGTSALTDKNGAIVNEPLLASTRIRGNVSQQMPKKPFAVKLDKKSGVLGMPAHKRWVLLANWNDRTLMRNAIAYDIAKIFQDTFKDAVYADGTSAAGMAWNPSGQFVELVYNGVYVGNYYLCEQIKIDGNRLDIAEPLDVDENPYDGDPAKFGYLFESDDNYDELTKFLTKSYIPFLFKDDGDEGGNMLTYAKGIVNGIEDNLYAGSWSAAYGSMDLASFVDFLLIQEVMMNGELANPKSCYSYIPNTEKNGVLDQKLYAGPIWDFDWQTIPNISVIESNYDNAYTNNGGKASYEFNYTESMLQYGDFEHSNTAPTAKNEDDKPYMWYPLLVQSQEFKDMAAQRWNAVKGLISSYADVQIPAMAEKIRKSEEENWKIWYLDSGSNAASRRYSTFNVGGGFKGDEAMSFDDAVTTMRSNLKIRISGMDYVSNQKWPEVSGAPTLQATEN